MIVCRVGGPQASLAAEKWTGFSINLSPPLLPMRTGAFSKLVLPSNKRGNVVNVFKVWNQEEMQREGLATNILRLPLSRRLLRSTTSLWRMLLEQVQTGLRKLRQVWIESRYSTCSILRATERNRTFFFISLQDYFHRRTKAEWE